MTALKAGALSALLCLTSFAQMSVASGLPGLVVSTATGEASVEITDLVLARGPTEGDEAQVALTVAATYDGPSAEFVVIVPIPGMSDGAQLRLVPRAPLEALRMLSSPTLHEVWELNPCAADAAEALSEEGAFGAPVVGYVDAATVGAEGAAMGSTIGAAEDVSPDAFELTLLSPRSSDPVEWLRRNNYSLDGEQVSLLQAYAARGDDLVLMKVAAGAVPAGVATELPLLQVTLDAAERPPALQLSQRPSADPVSVQVFVLAEVAQTGLGTLTRYVAATHAEASPAVLGDFGSFYRATLAAQTQGSEEAGVLEFVGPALESPACAAPPCASQQDEAPPGAPLGEHSNLSAAHLAALGVQAAEAPGPGVTSNDEPELHFAGVGDTGGEGVIDVAALGAELVMVSTEALAACLSPALASGWRPTVSAEPADQGVLTLAFQVGAAGQIMGLRARPSFDDGVEGTALACISRALAAASPPAPSGGAAFVSARWRVALPAARSSLTDLIISRFSVHLAPGVQGTTIALDGPVAAHERRTPGAERASEALRVRYAIRHRWEGESLCDAPRYGRWSAIPPSEGSAAADGSTTRAAAVDDADVDDAAPEVETELAAAANEAEPQRGDQVIAGAATDGASMSEDEMAPPASNVSSSSTPVDDVDGARFVGGSAEPIAHVPRSGEGARGCVSLRSVAPRSIPNSGGIFVLVFGLITLRRRRRET